MINPIYIDSSISKTAPIRAHPQTKICPLKPRTFVAPVFVRSRRKPSPPHFMNRKISTIFAQMTWGERNILYYIAILGDSRL